MEALLKALKSLISDIESMRFAGSSEFFFGPFSECEGHWDGTIIEWPNLAISLEEVKKTLKELNKPTHRHVKRGSTYQVLGELQMQISTPWEPIAGMTAGRFIKEGDHITVYRGEDGKLWGRFPDEFNNDRFEKLP